MPSMLLPTLFALMLAVYCIGGIPFGLLFSRAKGVDVRTTGSGNIGATNVARGVGTGVAVATLVCDVLKGFVCTFLGSWVLVALVGGGDAALFAPRGAYGWTVACLYLATVCGHVFSPYLHFRGGKGIAVGFGGALGFSWPIALGLLVVWALCAVPSRYVSAGSLCAAVALPFLAFFIYYPVGFGFLAPLILLALIVVWAHRENLERLRAGTEAPFSVRQQGAALEHEEEREVMAAQAGMPQTFSGKEEAPKREADVRTEAEAEEDAAVAQEDADAAAARRQADAVDVNDVDQAAEALARKDNAGIPAPGAGLFFGDELAVTKKVRGADAAAEQAERESSKAEKAARKKA